ncbi:MAG: ABC transporter permease subunit, partial [Alphaproteobacteria bacterium]|nr:ABC transporter permease subunit [Alphaproteobacteria bacterium]
MTLRLDSARATFIILLLFVSAVSLLPLARLVLEGMAPGGRWDPAAALGALGSRAAWRATIGSLETSIGGTAMALLLGGAMALLVAMTDIRGKAALVFCFVLPMMIPPQVTALAWLKAFGPASPVLVPLGLAPPLGTPNPLYGREGIILLLGVQHAPLAFLALRAGLRLLSPVQVEAAQVAGAGPLAVLCRVVLPLLAPAIAAAAALTFVSALGNFGIPALLGIPAKYATLPTLIYQRLAGFGPRVLPDMAALSLVVGGLALIGIAAQGWALKQRGARLVAT